MKKFLFLIVLLSLVNPFNAQVSNSDYFQTYYVPYDSSAKFFVDFKIPYSKIFFVKEKNYYASTTSSLIEIYRQDSLVKRIISKKNVTVNSFDETKSDSKLLHSFFDLELPYGIYNVHFSFRINNASSFALKFNKRVEIKKRNDKILSPIPAKKINNAVYAALSLEPVVNFSPSNISLLVPVNLSDTVCQISISQFDEKIYHDISFNYIKGAPFFALLGNNFIVSSKMCIENYKMFIFKNFALKLLPGKATIKITVGNYSATYNMKVVWDKFPNALTFDFVSENAMSMLFDKDEIKKYDNAPKNLKIKKLFEIWKPYDPDTSNAYNEILSEFFSRVDYAIKNFSSPKSHNGYKTDRGLIYIRYGKPLKIKQDFSEYDYNREIWDYGNMQYIFVDEKGNGNYILVK